MADVLLVGYVMRCSECFFIERTDKSSRDQVTDMIKKKQKQFMDHEINTPVIMYPEGTISSGKYLLPFKRGAFTSLLPIKPYICRSIFGNGPEISQGCLPAPVHMMYMHCYNICEYDLLDLPVIECTEFMLKNNKKNPEEKDYETFMNTTYEIMLEIGGLERTTKTLTEFNVYFEELKRLIKLKNKNEKEKEKVK